MVTDIKADFVKYFETFSTVVTYFVMQWTKWFAIVYYVEKFLLKLISKVYAAAWWVLRSVAQIIPSSLMHVMWQFYVVEFAVSIMILQ